MQVMLVARIVESLLGGINSQMERGTEAVVLITSVLEASTCEETTHMQLKGKCIRTILEAVTRGPPPTPTTVSNLLACLDIGKYVIVALSRPGEDSGLGESGRARNAVEHQGHQESTRHVSELLGLALALFSKAGGHIAGQTVLEGLLQPLGQHFNRQLISPILSGLKRGRISPAENSLRGSGPVKMSGGHKTEHE